MKCGHLFGFQCIHNWFGKSRTALCPNCSQLSKKSELRNIFATSVKLMDDSEHQQIMEKYLIEKELRERFEEQSKHLSISLEYLQMEIKGLEQINRELLTSSRKEIEEDFEYVLYKQIPLKTTYAFLVIDTTSQNILISYRDTKTVGYIKSEYTYDSYEYTSVLERCCDSFFVNEFRLSPWNDGFILLAYDKTVKMVNSNTGNEIITLTIADKIKCVCYNQTYRSIFHFCDTNGFLYTYDMEKLSIVQKTMLDATVHSISALKDIIIAGAFKNWYKVYTDKEPIIEKQTIPAGMQCIHIHLVDRYLVFNIVMPNKRTNLVIYQINKFESEKNNHLVLGTPKYLQIKSLVAKRNMKIYKNTLYLVNNFKNTIELYDLISYKVYYTIKFSEKIVDFDITDNRIVAISTTTIYIYSKELQKFATLV